MCHTLWFIICHRIYTKVYKGDSWVKCDLITLNNCLYLLYFFTMINFKEECIFLNGKCTQRWKYIVQYYTNMICFRFVFHSCLPLKQTFKEKGILCINGNIKKKNVNIISFTMRVSLCWKIIVSKEQVFWSSHLKNP